MTLATALFWILAGETAIAAPTSAREGRTALIPPAPTENWLAPDAEARSQRGRREWYERLHRAAPGVDWRAVERANHETNLLARRALVNHGAVQSPSWTTWEERGNRNQTGRTHVTALGTDGTTLFVGADKGGLFSGTIGSNAWQPRADNLGLGVHGLVIVPGSPEVWVALNDDGRLFASTNAGANWFVPSGLPTNRIAGLRVLRDMAAPRNVYVLFGAWHWSGSAWVRSLKLVRSVDGGLTFATLRTDITDLQGDIWISRTGASALYMMAGNLLSSSTNQGTSFTPVGTTPVSGDLLLAGSEAGAPTFYAAIKQGGNWDLYRSQDGGASWEFRFTITDFWESLTASMSDPQLVIYGGVNAYRSTDGGGSFAPINQWWEYYGDPDHKLHADLPGIDCTRIGGQEVFFFNTDGGTFISYDGGATVQNITRYGFGNGQYYSVLSSQNDPQLIAAGSQDQGYQISDPVPATVLSFSQEVSGDYGHLTSAAGNHNMLYAVYPGFILLQTSEASPRNIGSVAFPPASSYQWMPAILADPDNADRLYFGADHIWRMERVSGFNYSSTQLPQDFSNGSNDTVTALAISPADHSYWYAATQAGRLWYSWTSGASWTLSASAGPAAHYFYGNDLLCSPGNSLVCYVAGSGYSGPAVYRTVDGGITWTPMSTGLPSTLVFSLAFDNPTDQNLYAAAEAGPYRYSAGSWTSILGSEPPLTPYWDVEGVSALGVMRYATYGRGIWDYHIPGAVLRPDAALAAAASANPVAPSQGLVYRVSVTNRGPGSASGLELSDPLPAGSAFVTAAGAGWSCGLASNLVTCNHGPLAPLVTAPPLFVTLTTPSSPGTLTNTFQVTPTETDPVPANNQATVVTVVDSDLIFVDGFDVGGLTAP